MENPVKVRAQAMRTASILANLPELEQPVEQDGLYRYTTRTKTPRIRHWPEIDMDLLLEPDQYILPDDGSAPAVWPVEIAVAFQRDEGGIRLAMCKTASPRSLRGVALRWSKYNVEMHQITLDKYGRVESDGSGFFGRFRTSLTESTDEFVWSNLLRGGTYVSGRVSKDVTSIAPALAIGHALRQRYEWAVVFSFPSVRLRFGCSARGVLEMLRDRDKPAELGRRAALLHWVARHWRRASTAEDLHEVRKHLRGVTQCDWRGMSVSIMPAEYELEHAA